MPFQSISRASGHHNIALGVAGFVCCVVHGPVFQPAVDHFSLHMDPRYYDCWNNKATPSSSAPQAINPLNITPTFATLGQTHFTLETNPGTQKQVWLLCQVSGVHHTGGHYRPSYRSCHCQLISATCYCRRPIGGNNKVYTSLFGHPIIRPEYIYHQRIWS